MEQFMDYLTHNADSYILAIGEHLGMSTISLFIAMVIGVPGGFLCVRFKRSQKWITALFQTMRIIPSLAVLLLLIPIMGTRTRPAIAALVLLAVPPILLNTTAGLSDVSDFMLETAMGCGMTNRQVWLKVRFPLAMPMIQTGIKTALIEIIASATLAAKIGAGGLGGIIFTGLGLGRFDLLMIGGATVAILSLAAGLCMELLGRAAMPYKQL